MPEVLRDLASLIAHLVGAIIASLVGLEIARRLGRLRETEVSEHGRELSVECGAGLPVGQHPLLRRRTRLARAVVRPGAVDLSVFRWGLRVWRYPAFALDIASVDRASVRRAGWWAAPNASTTVRTVSVTTREGVLIDLSFPVEDVDTVLDVLEGRPRSTPSAPGAEQPELPELPRGWVWTTERTVRATSRRSEGGDVASQLHEALDDVEQQLALQEVPLSGLERLQVRTTDAHAVGVSIPALAARLRAGGAAPSITVLAVERLGVPGQLVELEVTAFAL